MTEQRTRVEKILQARAPEEQRLPGQERPLVLMIVDAVGSAAYVERFGEFAGAAMLQRFAEVAENAFGEYKGRSALILGDSMVAEFPGAEMAVRAGVEVHRRVVRLNKILSPAERLQIRVAVHQGVGILRNGEPFGDVLDTVAGLGNRCGPAQILVSRKVRESVALDHNLHCNWLGGVPLAGEPYPLDVFEVVWTDPDIYAEFRQHATRALVCGALVGAAVELDQIALPGMPLAPWPKDAAATAAAAGARPEPSDTRSLAGAARPLESRYEILCELGKGGMGIVYKARDLETSETVAVKVLRPEVASDAASMDRFKNELRTARRITHKNVCRIYEFQRTEGSAYITMEFVDGQNLRHLLETSGKLPFDQALECARQMCSGLREAHSENVIHRDLKPENIHLDLAGRVKIMDFGIARFSSTGATVKMDEDLVGTLAYMSPEQFEGSRVDHRADIYALGLILYEMFTGVPAFNADTTPALIAAHMHATPRPPSQIEPGVPPQVDQAIMKCLEKDPAHRFQSVELLALALLEAAAPPRSAPVAPAVQPPAAVVPAAAQPAGTRGTVALPRRQVKLGEMIPEESRPPLHAKRGPAPAASATDAAPAAAQRSPGTNPWWMKGLLIVVAAGVAAWLLYR